MIRPDLLIAAVRARGSDAADLRDAAHEACHALAAGVPAGQWDRETIHHATLVLGSERAVASEVMARAVEQLVCRAAGVDCGGPETWAMLSCLEGIKAGVQVPSFEAFLCAVYETMESPEGRGAADQVLDLARAEAA